MAGVEGRKCEEAGGNGAATTHESSPIQACPLLLIAGRGVTASPLSHMISLTTLLTSPTVPPKIPQTWTGIHRRTYKVAHNTHNTLEYLPQLSPFLSTVTQLLILCPALLLF